MPKVRKYKGFPDNYFGFKCPGCGIDHVLPTDKENKGKSWGFNYDLENPTFTPSILMKAEGYKDEEFDIPAVTCHSFVRNGKIEFLGDCTHSQAGKTLELEEIKC
jgi:hypothetical protein